MLTRYFFALYILILLSCTANSQTAYNFIVSKDGTGDFLTIQEAINATQAFPDEPVTIFIKNGVYNEKVRVYSWNTKLTLKGESAEKTIITYDNYFDKINLGRNSTFHTYTLKVEANDFTAKNLTIENSAGPVGQAVALHVEGDRCSFINCRLLGHQDTVYSAGEGRRHYFYQCYIDGTTDYIFGEGTAIFHKCQIHSKSNSYITAASTPKNIPFGFVFISCTLTANQNVDKVFLGRPWRDHARTVIMNCELGSHILPEGWSNWSGTNRDESAFYAEYGNTGPGADLTNRAKWVIALTEEEANDYTIGNIFSFGIGEWTPDK
ncbi:pectinesterase family protein [Natronoflexus pectinivorans]|uniref:Pectinesterase n=1 Tax=Natronoflexus pectinivorans TaxID=682526 RepID=A0A4V2RW46_9BACT|nr:pectinesterase family protein [Natronoflexus pectinivorans]TCO06784.1 pectinesterase [Natronoflexus pectinivorans]